MRTNVTRSFRSRERKCMGTKRPGTEIKSSHFAITWYSRPTCSKCLDLFMIANQFSLDLELLAQSLSASQPKC